MLGACSFPDYAFVPATGDAATCSNRLRDHDESDADCGGRTCTTCLTGQTCIIPKDCASGVCSSGTCAAPKCDDGVMNGRESALDCGESCSPNLCLTGETCRHGEDCQSSVCGSDGRCAKATCEDGQRNGSETDRDCGGDCKPCKDLDSCNDASDCESGICRDKLCVQPSCDDGRPSPGETDVDCGGPCGPCQDELHCVVAADCVSHSCVNQQCAAATCTDNEPNQDETDVDCGGPHCGGCAAGQLCVANSGCKSLVCSQQKCAEPSCDDFTQNGAETGVDCGGGCKRGCTVGMACAIGSDCGSGVCVDSVCQAPRCDDNVKNGSESDRDCGTGCKPCAVNRDCLSNDDCASKVCAETCSAPLHVDLLCPDTNPTATSPQQSFRIVNTGSVPFSLSSLSLRYYYTKEPAGDEQYNCYSVNGGACSLLGTVVFGNVVPKTSTADRYLELHYSAKAGSLGVNQSSEIRGAFFVDKYPAFTQSNDYSFSNNNGYLTSPRVTLYADGILIWGTEPTP